MGFGNREAMPARKVNRVLSKDAPSRAVRRVLKDVEFNSHRNDEGGILFAIGKGACVAFAIGFIYTFLFGPPSVSVNALMSAGGYGGPARLLPGERATISEESRDVMRVCLPEGDTAASASDEGHKSRFWHRVSMLAENVNGPEDALKTQHSRTLGFGVYLACVMAHERGRFCNSSTRSDLATEIGYYFTALRTDFDLAIERAKADVETEDFMSRIERIERTRHMSESERNAAGALPTDPIPNPLVVKNMRALIADGYLSDEDFGWEVSEHVRPHMKDVVLNLDQCGSRT